jgi:hypothetical protein
MYASTLLFKDILLNFKLQVALEDPKRFRIELTFSRGADLSPLEVMIYSLFGFPNKKS